MAGESPDRSKQRESSAEPTSGSAGPVPGARSESADPRLAMAREAKVPSGRAGVDTATRVLSARTGDDAPRDAERGGEGDDPGVEDPAAESAEPSGSAKTSVEESQESEETSGSGERGEGGSGGTGGRLRDAVAAWVSSADGGERRTKDAEDSVTAGSDDGPAREDAQEAAEKAPGGSLDQNAAEKAEEAEADRSATSTSGGGTGSEEAEPADAPASDADDEGGEDGGAAASAPERDADDAESGTSLPEADATPKPATAVTGAKTGTDTADGDKAGTAAAAKTPADSDTVGSGEAGNGTHADKAGPAAPPTGKPGTAAAGKPGTAAAKTPAGTAGNNTPAGKPGTAAAGKPGTAAKTPVDKADSGTAGNDTPADKAGPAAPAAPAADKTGAATGAAAKTPADKAGPVGGEGSEPPVDQPTAVFKAVRAPVDQPTTMLKLGGATKDTPEKDAAEKKVAPEKDAERTSKFVALKPLDDPAGRKPVPPAEATAPVPAVGPERTTQQPLPPKPPLDLLAELTNTPPPPDTPLRTAVRRVKIWTPLVLLLVIVFAVVQNVRPLPAPTLELTAKDSYTFEGGEVDIPWPAKGQAALDVQGIGTFGSSGEQKPVPIASVAKVMTAYVILRDHPLKSGAEGPKIDIDQAAEDQSDAGQESTVDVTKGDKITQREALESILIASANNVARLLARWDAGSEKAFVQKMNDAAEDLGMKNTTYTDPSGLNNTTVSTAVDQVKLAKAAMEQPAFREVAAMMSYVDYKGTRHDNWNRLVGSNDVTGIKTGTTTSALGNLVFSAKKDVDGETHRIIGAVVRQPAGGPDNTILGAALHEGDRLIRAAQGALETATILKKGTVVGYADDGLGGRTPVAVTEDVTAVGWAGLSVKLTFAADDLPHTAEAGTKVGTLTVGDGSSGAVKVPVALQEDLVEPGFADKLTRIA
ncbi:D-alanyl-D-alanine carboxypeptidase [Streptomyces sp. DT190]|uniref:D-alanyl-D-alanine carboxypeptidase n=1 Tax=unclassified Streptomyces TaxID=2593676 RepID=UPI003CEFAF33